MNIREIAVKNLLRRKSKAAFILAGLVIGVGTIVAVITYAETMAEDINHNLEKYGANILIVPHTDSLTLSYGGMTMGGVSFEMQPIAQSQVAEIRSIKNAGNLAAVGPIVLGSVQLDSMSALLAGVDFEAAAILKPWWKIHGAVPGPGEILPGAEAAQKLGLQIGQSIALGGRALTVSGILAATGSQDDQLLFTRLETAQAVLGKHGEVSLVEVAALCNDCPVEDMVTQIAQKLPNANVMAIQQVVKGRMETLAHFRKFAYGLSVVVILIGALVVLVTMMGSVKERTAEIGIFRAIGYRRAHIIRIVFTESAMISIMAGAIGYAVGLLAIWAGLLFSGIHAAHSVAFDPVLAASAVGLSLVVGLLASAYPAILAARMDPNQALSMI
jgi:putative ABC transport system permease protein